MEWTMPVIVGTLDLKSVNELQFKCDRTKHILHILAGEVNCGNNATQYGEL
jgi:hypothetical protein